MHEAIKIVHSHCKILGRQEYVTESIFYEIILGIIYCLILGDHRFMPLRMISGPFLSYVTIFLYILKNNDELNQIEKYK